MNETEVAVYLSLCFREPRLGMFKELVRGEVSERHEHLNQYV